MSSPGWNKNNTENEKLNSTKVKTLNPWNGPIMGFLEPSNLITNPTVKQDFYKINPAYYGRSYKYGHLTQNVFALSMEL